jgi:dTDP-4-dehydrorhamnose reductase
MDKIGVLGSRGRLGVALLQDSRCVPIDVDITDEYVVKASHLDLYPVVINCAAITDVDGCQGDGVTTPTYKKAVQVNCRALETVRKNFGGLLIHISSDYVFRGDAGPYTEFAKRDPINDYGFTKFGGEIVLETSPWPGNTVIVRTTGLYGTGLSFADYVIDCLSRGEKVLSSNTLFGNQTYVPHLARGLLHLAQMEFSDKINYLHLASIDIESRYMFAVRLARAFGLPIEKVCAVKSTEIANWVAPRPTLGGLDVSLAQHAGIPVYTIQEGVEQYIKERNEK